MIPLFEQFACTSYHIPDRSTCHTSGDTARTVGNLSHIATITAHSTSLDNPSGNCRNGEVADDTDNHEYDIHTVACLDGEIRVGLHRHDVVLQHQHLYLGEYGHRAEIENKVLSVELIDEKILKPVYEYLKGTNEDFKIMILPDHPTPVRLRTHTIDPVPFMIYDPKQPADGVDCFAEKSAAEKQCYLENGYQLMEKLLK